MPMQLSKKMMNPRKFLFLIVLMAMSCEATRKSRRTKEPKLVIYQLNQLPNDRQITTYLRKNEEKSFFYTSIVSNGSLSTTITTCTSPVRWKVEFSQENQTEYINLLNTTTNSMQTEKFLPTLRGVYNIRMVSEQDTFVHIYLSTEKGGPQTLQSAKMPNLRLIKRQRRKRLTIRWEPSLVDPQGTDYCLVVSTKMYFASYCAAQMAKFENISENNHLQLICVNRKTHCTISNLKQGQSYYFSLFATNSQSNFTYPYGQISTIFSTHTKPISLKDAKATFANLKKLDGKAVFRYKVGRKSGKNLDLFVMPCGGAVDIEVTLKEQIVASPKRIEGFGKISISNPLKSGRYYIKIFASNREELKKTTGVEIYATTRNLAKIPLPNLPQEPKIQEYYSLRKCDSVTVGWIAAPTVQHPSQYCLVVKEGKIREMDDYRMPNQCGLESRLKKSADFTMEYCRDVKQEKEGVLTQKINQLKPGRNYIVQVTVRKPKGKTLSYDLLQVYTKSSCHNKRI